MGQLVSIDKGKFEKTKGTRGKPGRYIREIELENIYKQNVWLLNLDDDYFNKVIKDGFPNQVSAEYFINCVVSQIKDADTALKKFEVIANEEASLSVARWIFYQRLGSCATAVLSLLDGYKFKRQYKTEIKRILKEYKYLYKVNKPEEKKLKVAYEEAKILQKKPWLLDKKKNILLVLEGLLISYEDAENGLIKNGISERFQHITKCLYHSLKPLIELELSKFSKKQINDIYNPRTYGLRLFGIENSFTSIFYLGTDHIKNIKEYKTILDALSLNSLNMLFTKGIDVVISNGGAYFNSELRPTLFKATYDTESMTEEELRFHKYERFQKVSMFEDYYEEFQKEIEEFNKKFPPIPVSKIFYVNEQKMIEGKPEDKQLFLKQQKTIMLQY